jgi:hypothetical protein
MPILLEFARMEEACGTSSDARKLYERAVTLFPGEDVVWDSYISFEQKKASVSIVTAGSVDTNKAWRSPILMDGSPNRDNVAPGSSPKLDALLERRRSVKGSTIRARGGSDNLGGNGEHDRDGRTGGGG